MVEDLRRRTSEVRYAQCQGAHLAYRVVAGNGGGEHDVVLVLSGTMPMDAMFEDPVALRFLEGLADLGRLVIFDRAGIGLSDPPSAADPVIVSRWCDDLEAVIAAAQVEHPVLVSNMLGTMVAIIYADRHPNDVTSVVLLEPAIVRIDRDMVRARILGEVDPIAIGCPSRADEPGFRDWFNRAGQVGASPGLAVRAYPQITDAEEREIEQAASRVRVPTLVLRRPAHALSPPRASDPVTELVPGSVRVDLPGRDLWTFGGEVDALLTEVARFVTGEHRILAPQRVLAAVVFSDLVASTARATALGDAHWKRLLDRHDEIAASCIARRGGTVIKTMGDGIFAILPSANSAMDAAIDLCAALRHENLDVRVGIHVGDVDRRGEDLSGVGVATAARIQSLAGTGEILVSATAVQAANGGSHHFEPRGEHQLKGVSGTWQLFALTKSNPQTST